MYVKETKNYDLFKNVKGNRKVREKRVRELVLSINRKNLLSACPIVVNRDMAILDGQHRLEAARRMDLSVYYMVVDDIDEDDVGVLNSVSKNWVLSDYLNYYIEKQKPQYLRYREILLEFDLSHSVCLRILSDPRKTTDRRMSTGHPVYTRFTVGDFEIVLGEEEISEYVGMLTDIRNLIGMRGIAPDQAILDVITMPGYDHSVMVKALEESGDIFRVEKRVLVVERALIDVYNELADIKLKEPK